MTPDILARARRVRLLGMDVDGTLTDAGMYYGENGEEFKKFNTRDGMGVGLLREAGLKTAFLTSENTPIVTRRAAKMRIDYVRLGARDKLSEMRAIVAELGITLEEVAYIGDDLNDCELLAHVGLAVAVQDASAKPRALAHYVTQARGGEGAVRELCNLILEARATTSS
ncbi:MAG: HAD hydrolase family protein [Chloroflexota bacterium]